jgi:hypothetical protein
MMVAMAHLDTQDPVAVATVEAIRSGDVGALRRLLDMYPDLTTVRLGDPCGMSRTLLHVATDWPGHFPNGPQMIEVLVEAGADVNGRHAAVGGRRAGTDGPGARALRRSPRPPPRTSPMACGRPATAAGAKPRSSSSSTAATSTGSATTG